MREQISPITEGIAAVCDATAITSADVLEAALLRFARLQKAYLL